jgi:hypothetical protein
MVGSGLIKGEKMDLSKKGLSEFKSLMKDSKKDWDRNKKLFNEGRSESLNKDNQSLKTVPVTFADSDPGPDSDGVSNNSKNGERRKRQIDLGHMILGYFKEEESKPKKTVEERVGPGRPKKEKADKVRVISLKIRPEYVEFLKSLSFGRGIGSRIRIIIDDWNRYKKREREQVGVLKKTLIEMDGAIKRYAQNYDRAENLERNEATISELNGACKNIKILVSVLKFEIGDLKGLLSKEEFRNLEFAYSYLAKVEF